MRALAQILLFALGIGALALVAKGLAPVFPALTGILRIFLHPVGILILGALIVLIRIGRGRQLPLQRDRDRTDD